MALGAMDLKPKIRGPDFDMIYSCPPTTSYN